MTETPAVHSKQDIWQTFDRIALDYDQGNRWLSLGLDRVWRRQLIRMLPAKGDQRVLDIATGTADLLISLVHQKQSIAQACGLDLSRNMLEVGKRKIERKGLSERVFLKKGDMHALPFAEKEFDVVTAAFGLRNAADPKQVLKEMLRVLRPGGFALILEFSLSQNPALRRCQKFYLEQTVPLLGGLISGNRAAYRYLSESIQDFPSHEAFCVMLREAGFADVQQRILFPGITSVYKGQKGE